MAHGVPAARHCVPPHPDRHAVRHGAAAVGVTFLHPLALAGLAAAAIPALLHLLERRVPPEAEFPPLRYLSEAERQNARRLKLRHLLLDRKSTRLNSSHLVISYAVFCLKKKKTNNITKTVVRSKRLTSRALS